MKLFLYAVKFYGSYFIVYINNILYMLIQRTRCRKTANKSWNNHLRITMMKTTSLTFSGSKKIGD